MEIIEIPRYCATNSYIIWTEKSALLIDTGYPSTLASFNASLSSMGISSNILTHMMATHYHPDHVGLMPILNSYGIELITFGEQIRHLHDPDGIFAKIPQEGYSPLDESKAISIPIGESRNFLESIGIEGQVISLPSHTLDSIGIILDSGEAFVGDLTPLSWIDIREETPVSADWVKTLSYNPRTIYYGHAPKETIR